MLADAEDAVRVAALVALRTLDGAALLPHRGRIEQIAQDATALSHVRIAALVALGSLDDPPRTEPIAHREDALRWLNPIDVSALTSAELLADPFLRPLLHESGGLWRLRPGFHPMKHQLEAAKFCAEQRSIYALAHGMGLGKTFTTLLIFAAVHSRLTPEG